MGWLFQDYASRKDVIDELTQGWENDWQNGGKATSTCLAKCYRGSSFAGTLYAVFERRFYKADGTENTSMRDRFIFVALMRYSNYQNSRSWGYKDMEESMGPNVNGCPQKYFKMVPCPDHPFARHFRENCNLAYGLKSSRRQLNRDLRKGLITLTEANDIFSKKKAEFLVACDESQKKTDADYEAWREKKAKEAEAVAV